MLLQKEKEQEKVRKTPFLLSIAWAATLSIHIALIVFFTVVTVNSALKSHNKKQKSIAHKNKPIKVVKFRSLDELKNFKKITDIVTKKRIVQNDDSLKSNLKKVPKKEKVFLGKKDFFVKKNQRAKKMGEFKNNLKSVNPLNKSAYIAKKSRKPANTPSPDKKTNIMSKLLTLNPVSESKLKAGAHKIKKPTGRLDSGLKRSPQSNTNYDGASQTDDFLPDIAIGNITQLNTREYIYYSFYERIRKQLKHKWQNLVKEKMLLLEGKEVVLSQTHYITKLKVTLDSDGELESLKVINGSNYAEIDAAAVEAFNHAAPFNNPPKGMFQEGEEVLVIDWDFILMARPGKRVKVKINGQNPRFR